MNPCHTVFICLLFFTPTWHLHAQSAVSWGKPLDLPAQFSGSFGELRSQHFHGGVDFRTQQREGYPVRAVADGRIVRISVSSRGYGKCLYLLHPDGFMSVYAHLSLFTPALESLTYQQQERKKSYSVDFPVLSADVIRKGDIIAYSGNTGSSGGPHLHFEMRNAQGDIAMHPGLLGYTVIDRLPPTLRQLVVYPIHQQSRVNEKKDVQFFRLRNPSVGSYTLRDTLKIRGSIALGVEAFDKADQAPAILGLYRLRCFIDEQEVFAWKLDQIAFSETHHINAFIDYGRYDSTGQRIQWTRRLPGNSLSIYEDFPGDGIFEIEEEGIHNLRVEAYDFQGNVSTLRFVVRVDHCTETSGVDTIKVDSSFYYAWNKEHLFRKPEIEVHLPARSLYESIFFHYASIAYSGDILHSDLHQVHFSSTPLQESYHLRIRPHQLPESLQSKALIVSVDAEGKIKNAEGGKYEDGFFNLRIKKFSIFAIAIDTLKPEIKPLNIRNNIISPTQDSLFFKIHDALSGIGHYEARIDGKWMLMGYDPRTKQLFGRIDPELARGEHLFELSVSDQRQNIHYYSAKLQR